MIMSPKDSLTYRMYQRNTTILAEKFVQPQFEKVVTTIIILRQAKLINSNDFFQRWSNDEYLGELYVERDFKEGERKGSTCRFVLGTRQNALSYINQVTPHTPLLTTSLGRPHLSKGSSGRKHNYRHHFLAQFLLLFHMV